MNYAVSWLFVELQDEYEVKKLQKAEAMLDCWGVWPLMVDVEWPPTFGPLDRHKSDSW